MARYFSVQCKPGFLKGEWMIKITRLKVLLFVLLPKVACENDKKGGTERTHYNSHLQPEIDHLTRLALLCWQRYSSCTETWLCPHIHRVLKNKSCQHLHIRSHLNYTIYCVLADSPLKVTSQSLLRN